MLTGMAKCEIWYLTARNVWQEGGVWYRIVARSRVLYPPLGKSRGLVPESARHSIRDLGFSRASATKPLEIGRNRGTKPADLAGAALKNPSTVPNWRSWQRAAVVRDGHRACDIARHRGGTALATLRGIVGAPRSRHCATLWEQRARDTAGPVRNVERNSC